MKYAYYLLHLFFIILFCNTAFAEVTDEEFEKLNQRVKGNGGNHQKVRKISR